MPSISPRDYSFKRPGINAAAEIVRLQKLMNQHAGPLRTRAGLEHALRELKSMRFDLPAPRAGFDAEWLDLHDLASMRQVAECVASSALAREESRGAHQREDFPEASAAWERHQVLGL